MKASVALFLVGVGLGSVPPVPWSIEEDSWITDESFFDPFDYIEKKQHFCRRSWMAPSKPNVVYFDVWDDMPEVALLRSACGNKQTKLDDILLDQMKAHPWLVPKNDPRAVFHYLHTLAGPVLAGECAPEATKTLTDLLASIRKTPEWEAVHGHNFIHLASTPAVYENVYNRSKSVFTAHFRYDQPAMQDPANPRYQENIPYTLSQMISLQDIYVPGLQYCQLFRPVPLTYAPKRSDQSDPPTWEDYQERGIEYLMVEAIGDPKSPKYAVRQAIMQAMVSGEFGKNYKLVVLGDLAAIGVSSAPACVDDASAPICTVANLDDLSKMRATLMPEARWYILTRGEKPHEENLYQAMWAETLVVNTIDKNLDHALPFQCTVHWEDFTVRVGSERAKAAAKQEIVDRVNQLHDDQLTKMLRYMRYYGPELDYLFTYDHEAARNSTNLPENILLGAMRRCYPEQWLNERRMSAGQMQCCGNEYAKFSIIARRTINVDMPPWGAF